MKLLPNARQAMTCILIVIVAACHQSRPVELASPTHAVAGVLEIANGYGGKLMIASNPKITGSLRNIVRVDSFYVDASRPDGRGRPPQYRSLLVSPLSTGTDTVGGNPALIIDGRLGGWEVGRAELFNPNTRSVLEGEDIVTIGVLSPAAALMKYGEHGRNGAIVMMTRKIEYPDDPGSIVSGGAAFDEAIRSTTRRMPGQVSIRFVVDTTGHVEAASFVVVCRHTPGAFLDSAQKKAILAAVWKPARLRGRPLRESNSFSVNTLVDSAKTAGDGISLCRH